MLSLGIVFSASVTTNPISSETKASAYNIPGVPPYNQPTATLIHAALTVVPIWVITYIFLPKVYRIYKLRNEKKEDK